MSTVLIDAARAYIKRGWTPIALGPDAEGRPKRPLAGQWESLRPLDERTRKQGWRSAIGIGLLCGPNSNNLAVIDIDDVELAAAVFAKLARGHQPFRWVWTGRNRGHLYVREQEPSEGGQVWRGTWEGRAVGGELRCKGQQVAAPPSPGYVLAQEQEPQAVENVRVAFDAICLAMGIEPMGHGSVGANYPPAWQDTVRDGTRNDSLFVEACKLAAVRMPVERAVELLRANIERHYERGDQVADREFEATVRSAYQRAWPKVARPAESDKYRRELR